MPAAQTPDDRPPDDAPAGEMVEVELARSLGLAEALAIGVGTMISVGIFVLPGLVIARAGPAAVLSFLFAGLVALFGAMSAAEVATGMPKSGGGYYFISRALGPLWGAIIGWGSWSGLIFASAFYMVGLGEYIHTVVAVPPRVLAVGTIALLVGLNFVGSRAAGQAQNLIVAALLAVMLLFIGRGLASVNFGYLAQDFMPFGIGGVFAGTATLFVTYCGYGEIASMAEEIKEPGRNLPRALLGSVIGVMVLYVAMLVVCVSLRPAKELVGPTVVADLASDLMGSAGRGLILLGAVLASVSSANAGIMSASRVSFAMGRDSLIWDWLNQVHPRFRVPHRAIVVTGLLTVAVILVGNIELLAEAAGLLHLLLYGLICVACIILRGAGILAYRPVYRVPLFPLIPIMGAAGTVAIAVFMKPIVLLIGAGIVLLAVAHYHLWARRRTELRGAWPYFLRRGVLEPALERVERWGAVADELPTALVAVRNPERERARMQVAAAIMGPTGGQVLAINVFTVDAAESVPADVLTMYYETIEARAQALQDAAAPILEAGGEVVSRVPIAPSAFYGLLSAAEASGASVVFLGWPEAEPDASSQIELLAALDRHVRAHLLILRQRGPIPATSILAIIDSGTHGDLALLAAARMANAWGAKLTVATVVPESVDDETMAQAHAHLEGRVGDIARADVRPIPAASLAEAVALEAPYCDMLVLGVPGDAEPSLASTITRLQHVTDCSLVLVRADENSSLDLWM